MALQLFHETLVLDPDVLDEARASRGEWEINQNKAGVVSLVGFDGENAITVHMMGMQSGRTEAVIVESMVDSRIKVLTYAVQGWENTPSLAKWINEALDGMMYHKEPTK